MKNLEGGWNKGCNTKAFYTHWISWRQRGLNTENSRAVCDTKDLQHILVLFKVPNVLPHRMLVQKLKRNGGREELASLQSSPNELAFGSIQTFQITFLFLVIRASKEMWVNVSVLTVRVWRRCESEVYISLKSMWKALQGSWFIKHLGVDSSDKFSHTCSPQFPFDFFFFCSFDIFQDDVIVVIYKTCEKL